MSLDPRIREVLELNGLKQSANDDDAIRYWLSLTGEARAAIDALAAAIGLVPPAATDEPERTGLPIASPPVVPVASGPAPNENELRRIRQIRNLAKMQRLGDDWAERHIASGASFELVCAAAMDDLVERDKPVRFPSVTVEDRAASLPEAVSDAIYSRATGATKVYGPDGASRPIAAAAREFAGLSLLDIGKRFLAQSGVPVAALTGADLRHALWDVPFHRGPVGLHTSSDFPGVLSNAASKAALLEYGSYEVQWPLFCRKATARDFREVKRVGLGEYPTPPLVLEGGEYTMATVGDRNETCRLAKYGSEFQITWEAIVNDDLDVFSRLPRSAGRACRRLEDTLVAAELSTNGAMSDGNPLFDAAHGNLSSVSDVPSVATLDHAALLLRTMTGGPSGSVLGLTLKTIIVPAALEAAAERLRRSEYDPDAGTPWAANRWFEGFTVAVLPQLDQYDTQKWYAAADPSVTDTIEVCFLSGYEVPSIIQVESRNPDVRSYVVRHVVAAKALSWVGLIRNDGEGA